MATEEELIAIRVAVRAVQQANRDLGKVARALDDVGDEAEQADRKADKAARSITRLSASSNRTRVSLGPFSTSLRGATLVIGGMVVAADRLTPAVLSAGEAVATLAGGAGAAGGVGLLALGQAGVVASLGLGDLTDALGGNEEAARRLSPEAYELYRTLTDARDALKETAQAAMLPGLTRGGMAAMRNFGVLQNIVHATGTELGRLAGDAGAMLGSAEWGRDLGTLGRTNVKIIGNLGDAGLHLADALKDILVVAAPLAEWLSEQAETGAELVETWADGARKGGDLRDFFQGAKTDLDHLGDSVGNVVSGIQNLFESQSVDGSGLLADIEKITQRFEDWTNSPAVQEDFGAAITKEIADGVAAAAGAAAETLPLAAGAAAKLFWDSFWTADPEAKALIALLTGAKLAGSIRGMTPLTPLYVQNVGGVLPGQTTDPKTKTDPKTGKPTGETRGRGGPRGSARGGVAATVATLIGAEVIPEGPVKDALFGVQDDDAIRRQIAAGFPHVGRVGEGNPNPLHVGGAFDPVIQNHIVLKLNGEVLAEHMGNSTAKRNARKR